MVCPICEGIFFYSNMSDLLLEESVGDEELGNSITENASDSQEDGEGVLPTEEDQKEKLLRLPLARIKHIVKFDPEVNLINQEATFLITKSTELFIESLSKESYKYTLKAKKKTLQKQDVFNAIDNVGALVFLEGML